LRITEELGVPQIIADRKKFSELSKEHSSLQSLVDTYRDFMRYYNNYLGSVEVLENEKDPDLLAMAKEDISSLEPVIEKKLTTYNLCFCPKILEMKRTLFLKSEQEWEGMRLVFLQLICIELTCVLQNQKGGRLSP
jgi:peptide chain release factor 1